ncbi:energy transducer TonB [bacterium]|nr:energy transducer TonB [bacterium]
MYTTIQQEKQVLSVSFLTALAIHLVLLLSVGASLSQSPSLWPGAQTTRVEVNLVGPTTVSKDAVRVAAVDKTRDLLPMVPEKHPVTHSSPSAKSPAAEQPPFTGAPPAQSQGHVSDSSTSSQSESSASAGRGNTISRPDAMDNPPPLYPESARRRGQQGTVLLSVDITSDGRPAQIRVKKTSGFPLLDEAALKAVRKWKFKPATSALAPIASTVEVPVRFELSGE